MRQMGVAIAVLLASGCTSSNDGVGSGGGIASIGSLPKITASVKAATGRSATSGAKLSEFSSLTWDSSKSRAMCFTGDAVRNLLSEASGPDLALCQLGVLETHNLLSVSYDGSAQYFSVANMDSSRSPRYFKFDATKTDSTITDFHLFSCTESAQDSYLTATLSDGASGYFVSMRSLSHFASGGNTGKQFATTSGNVDSQGEWTEKMIAFQGINSSSIWNRNMSVSINQTAVKNTISGSFSGSASGVNEAACFWSASQALTMDLLSTASMGDGIMKSKLSVGTQTCDGVESTVAWSGDTRAPLSDVTQSEYYSDSTGMMAVVPTLATVSESNVAFITGTDWNCVPGSGAFTEIDLTAASEEVTSQLQACEQRFSLSRAGTNCQNAGT